MNLVKKPVFQTTYQTFSSLSNPYCSKCTEAPIGEDTKCVEIWFERPDFITKANKGHNHYSGRLLAFSTNISTLSVATQC